MITLNPILKPKIIQNTFFAFTNLIFIIFLVINFQFYYTLHYLFPPSKTCLTILVSLTNKVVVVSSLIFPL